MLFKTDTANHLFRTILAYTSTGDPDYLSVITALVAPNPTILINDRDNEQNKTLLQHIFDYPLYLHRANAHLAHDIIKNLLHAIGNNFNPWAYIINSNNTALITQCIDHMKSAYDLRHTHAKLIYDNLVYASQKPSTAVYPTKHSLLSSSPDIGETLIPKGLLDEDELDSTFCISFGNY